MFFHCNRSDDTTEISPYRKSYTVAPGQTTLTTDWHCGTSESSVYATPGEVTAKVVLRQLVDRQDRRAQATTTITVLPQDTTPTPEPSPDHSIVLRGGYNAVNIPASWGDVRIGFDHFAGSLTIFDFNWFGDENWRPTNNRGKVTEMIPGLGYYIYSPAETTLGVYSVNTGKVPVIKQGWNLLSNSTGEALNVASASFRVIKPDQTNKDCNETGCSEAKTLKQLISAGRGYSVIYELVNPYTANPDEVWRTHEIRPDTADEVEIPANRNFWFYLDRETRWTPWE